MLRSIFFFDAMLTPKIITFVYWIILFFVVISGLGTMFSGMGLHGFLMGLVIIVIGGVFSRIWCELLIVLFKINDNLKKVVDKDNQV